MRRPFTESKALIDSQLIPCGRCGEDLALFIFAHGATDAGSFEDYARRMYPEFSRLNVATWILGPAVGNGPMIERPADMLKVWPVREPMIRQQPATLNVMLDELRDGHCR